ncbi:hypothetical protein SI65_03833 [Aspergillus cristatus]|uniref:Nitrogen regulatory protein areA GATA-like domain-containing protein n=1 Tax=Aspergillus cristatus TaxID=573508 RepID=A0A1E3BIJ1_ASPCR|nr:hypothetical protein SI65_03833 [Aspergillus cristatus]
MDLPKGLVTTSTRIPSHLKDPNVIDAVDIAQLWKVYHTNPAVHNNDSGHRLENFFWRVWGNERLRCSLQGETLATLFVNIAESQAQKFSSSSSVVKSKSLGKMSSVPTISKVNAQPPPTPPTEENEPDNTTRNSNARSNSDLISNSNTNTRTPLPPILKKPKSVNGNESPQKKARLLLTRIGGQHVTRKPSNPLTPISPPPFAAATKEDPNATTTTTTTDNDITAITATNTTTNTTTAATTRAQYQYQKKPYLVASKASKRRPVLGRRKSSQTAVPRYEAKSDYFGQGDTNATTPTNPSPKTTTNTTVCFNRDEDDDLKEQTPVTPADEEGPINCEKTAQKESSDTEAPAPLDQENHQSKQDERTESPNESQPPDGKYANTDDPNLKNLPPNLVSNLKLVLAQQKPTTTNTTRPNNTKSRSKHIPYPSTTTNTTTHRLTNHERDHLRRLKSSTYIHQLQHQLQQHKQPAKLVDDHFRLRFAEELQREEKFLNTVNSLPEEERSAVLEGHSGRSKAPRIPRTSWVEVLGGGGAGVERDSDTDRIQQERPEAAANDNDDGWSSTGEDGGGWAADDAQDHYSDTQVDAAPFKFEGMSYASSWRAACRLQVPGQLTVLLRAEQYRYRGDAEIVDST